MLEVHPPHESAHSWRDFFIHIATIVVGLLIAIALEQMVEWIHHQHELHETRATLHEELLENIQRCQMNVYDVRRVEARLQNNLRVIRFLQEHPGTPIEKLPGIVNWGMETSGSSQAAWNTAKQSEVFALMPNEEVEYYRQLYDSLTKSDDRTWAVWDALNKASAYSYIEPDLSKLSSAQIAAEMVLLQDCMRANFQQINALNNVAKNYPEFYPGPPDTEPSTFMPKREVPSREAMSEARAFNQPAIQLALSLEKADEPARLFSHLMAERGGANINSVLAEVRKSDPTFTPNEDDLDAWGSALITRDKNLKAAIAVLTLNVQLYPNSWNVYDSLGDAYAREGRNQEAIENYEHSIRLNPNATSSIDALRRLRH